MRKVNILFFLLVFLFSCSDKSSALDKASSLNKSKVITYETFIKQNKPNSLLLNIQSKIRIAFLQDIVTHKNTQLAILAKQLDSLYSVSNQNLIRYWQAYTQFYISITYMDMENKKRAGKENDIGVNYLKGIKNKNSEDYALLAMMQGFSIQFKGMRVVFISSSAKENAQNALLLDSTNLRANYVYASNDFYTPKAYGGGEEAEKYLLKAISLPEQKVKNGYLPSWGKEETYEMLVKLYIKKKNWELAKKYYRQGLSLFPKSYRLNQLAAKLVGR